MRIYEINQSISEIIDNAPVDEETGEILIDFDAISKLEMAKEERVESLIKVYKEYLRSAKAIREEEKELAQRRQQRENKAERLKSYLDSLHPDKRSTEYGNHMIRYRKSVVVEGSNIETLPEQFIKVEKKADRIKLKEYLKASNDHTVEGWDIVEKQNIQIA